MTVSIQRKNDRESAHMHPTDYMTQDGSKGQIFLLSSSPFSSEKEKLVSLRAKWITGYVLCTTAVFMSRIDTTDVAQLLRFRRRNFPRTSSQASVLLLME